MVTSLGCDISTSCAAARAGLVRAQVLDNYHIRSAVEGDEELVIGHPVRLLTQGFENGARLSRLLQGALLDLMTQTKNLPWKGKSHRFYLSLPNPQRIQNEESAITAKVDNPQNRQLYLAQLSKILAKAVKFSHWDGDSSIGFISTNGNIAGLEAIQAAVNDLISGSIEVAIVLGADSLLDEGTLSWLHQSGRLKCDGSPSGLQPGEAGVALALAQNSCPGKSGRSSVILRNPIINNKGHSFLSDESPTGEGIADALLMAKKGFNTAHNWIISDHNGEAKRAFDWGHAIVRLRAMDHAYSAPSVWYPAGSFGDTGAASALLAVCIAAKAFERKYALTNIAMIASTSDGTARGALTLSPNYA